MIPKIATEPKVVADPPQIGVVNRNPDLYLLQ